MEKRIKERYNDIVLCEAMRRYGIARDQIRLLDGFESFMHEFERGQEAYILRIAHSFRRSEALIHGEVDWINYLADGGASVARAILSEDGKLVEPLDDGHGEHFLATAFVKAPGKPPGKTEWNAGLFETYGQLVGRMHALSKCYEPASPAWRRPHWDGPQALEVEQFLPASETVVVDRYHALMEYLHQLSRDDETYVLIHQDAHAGNFFVDDTGKITLFDFDDCVYSWMVNDIAIVLFYAAMGEGTQFTSEFMTNFLRGYRQENRLDARWLKEIPYFLKLREIDLYAVIHRSFDVDNLDNAWCARYMHNRKHKIENDVPYLDFDFELLAEYI